MDGISLDDRTLVSRVLAGEANSFGPLFERYQAPILKVAMGIVHDREEARDVAQSVFLKVFQKLESFNPRYRFFSWLYRIAINESLNVAARNRRFPNGLDREYFSEGRTPEEICYSTEVGRKFEAALAGLPTDYRSLITLRHQQGCSYREISDILGIPERRVKSRLFSARQAFRKRLQQKGVGINRQP